MGKLAKTHQSRSVDTLLARAAIVPHDTAVDLLVDNPVRAAREKGGKHLKVLADIVRIANGLADIPESGAKGLSTVFWDSFSEDGDVSGETKSKKKKTSATTAGKGKKEGVEKTARRTFTHAALDRAKTIQSKATKGEIKEEIDENLVILARDSIESAAIKAGRVLFEHLYTNTDMMKKLRTVEKQNQKKRKLMEESGDDKESKIGGGAQEKLAEWLRKMRTAYVQVCLDSIVEPQEKNDTHKTAKNNSSMDRHRKQIYAIEALFTILKLESQLAGDLADIGARAFDNAFFTRIVQRMLVFDGRQMTSLVRQELLRRIDSFVDIRYYFYKALTNLLQDGTGKKSIATNLAQKGSKYRILDSEVSTLVENGLSILLRVTTLKTTEEDDDERDPEAKLNIIKGKSKKFNSKNKYRDALPYDEDGDIDFGDSLDSIRLPDFNNADTRSKAKKIVPTVEGMLFIPAPSTTKNIPIKIHASQIANNARKVYGECWVELLRQPLSPQLHRQILVVLHTKIVPFVRRPEMFISFLSESYDAGGVSSLLALNGLYELMTKTNLDYPKFWEQLYALLVPDIFQVKYRERFIELFNLFMSSAHLPSALVASFLKRLSKLMLRSPLDIQKMILPLMLSMIKRHPATVVMIHKVLSEEESSELIRDGFEDPYDENETDPLKTNAIESSLWELDILKEQHFSKEVTQIFDLISNRSIFSL